MPVAVLSQLVGSHRSFKQRIGRVPLHHGQRRAQLLLDARPPRAEPMPGCGTDGHV
jgi:hypothetical protein